MIKPSIGRIVWVHRVTHPSDQPEAAIVTYVHSDDSINIAGFQANGAPFNATKVFLKQDDGDETTAHDIWAEWMPYQKTKAAEEAPKTQT